MAAAAASRAANASTTAWDKRLAEILGPTAAVRAVRKSTQEYVPPSHPHADSGDGTHPLTVLSQRFDAVQCGINCGCIWLDGCAEEKGTECGMPACCGKVERATSAVPASPKPAHEMER